jgi:hypothetical protein
MLKARLEPMIQDVCQPGVDLDITSSPDNMDALKERCNLMCQELTDLCTLGEDDFDNPYVLSFLTNLCLNGSFVPKRYY